MTIFILNPKCSLLFLEYSLSFSLAFLYIISVNALQKDWFLMCLKYAFILIASLYAILRAKGPIVKMLETMVNKDIFKENEYCCLQYCTFGLWGGQFCYLKRSQYFLNLQYQWDRWISWCCDNFVWCFVDGRVGFQ